MRRKWWRSHRQKEKKRAYHCEARLTHLTINREVATTSDGQEFKFAKTVSALASGNAARTSSNHEPLLDEPQAS